MIVWIKKNWVNFLFFFYKFLFNDFNGVNKRVFVK